ncbi:hypothetical protein AX16_009800 [Volvariella volvacea WC 439]|nr:hypothetical protein AX16_009800 [Volvariella volvacea WC 439]
MLSDGPTTRDHPHGSAQQGRQEGYKNPNNAYSPLSSLLVQVVLESLRQS